MGDGHTFGDNNQNVFGGQNSGFGYHVHNTPQQPRPSVEQEAARAAQACADYGRSRSVFVVHGRDEKVRGAMFGLLRRLDLRPLEWERLVRATGGTAPFLGAVVEKALSQAQAALVLLTPDDVAKLHPHLLGDNEPVHETQLTGQPRQNVLIELGMALMAYPERTIIVQVGQVRPAADLAGRNVIHFDGSETAVSKIVERLKGAECDLDDTRPDWRDISHFRNLAAYRRLP
ncbi:MULTISPECIES: TIR domain-containing protein [unclassified Streptomyces]|uniref:TIR domain-containing protein n=1 Tax=unclassified Streptomyces TaxID=2593676 RepID=UPI001F04F577|nr:MULTISPECIES: TIR domain-containing protein [unclassified Streptomyces]MCH0562100.1 nucleotide-binding protein [Streptomyces sp. MUM 2J]MCH0568105.1 nucleotide-binding protein [Streptomyces sp. MUM 136J]